MQKLWPRFVYPHSPAAACSWAHRPAAARAFGALPQRAIVAGAGMAGLWAAWVLEQAGLQVTVLEAGLRIGGRNWTVRPGDTVPGTAGSRSQRCTFSDGQYLNAGPWRILPWHHRVLACALRHGIALETPPGDTAALQAGRGHGRATRRWRMRCTPPCAPACGCWAWSAPVPA